MTLATALEIFYLLQGAGVKYERLDVRSSGASIPCRTFEIRTYPPYELQVRDTGVWKPPGNFRHRRGRH